MSSKRDTGRLEIAYVALLAGALAAAIAISWTAGLQVDRSAYDWMFRRYEPSPWTPRSVILAIDEQTLTHYGEIAQIRRPLADALKRVAMAKPSAVALDVTLAGAREPVTDAALEEALRATPNLVLSTAIIDQGPSWEEPLERFRPAAAAIGHVHAQPEDDWVTRAIPLEKIVRGARDRRWALSLEAFRLSRGATIEESPRDVRVGSTVIPAPRVALRTSRDGANEEYQEGRLMRIRFVPPSMAPIPRVSMKNLLEDATLQLKFTAKVVFVGVTAQSGTVVDRLATPYSAGVPMPGVEIHANAFETMSSGQFITDVWAGWLLLFCLGLTVAAGATFLYVPGRMSYALAVLILTAGHVTPYVFFTYNRVFSFAASASTAWFATLTAAGWQFFVVRRRLRRAEAERTRYQQAMHFVTHEMRTPLSAIQGSSELISRYPLTEEKRKQVALLINSESKRLARMIEVFLNVEKLSAGQMELKRETIVVKDLVEVCMVRTGPLAERKHITVSSNPVADDLQLTGDRELMEYACYNLLTNAVKYSPQRTAVTVSAWRDDGHIRIAVQDQGIGMDQKEVKKIFQKFYRTRRAEESGEAGTGIGLSIVQQIVEQHGGRIDVTSRPGEGSCFTLVLSAAAAAPPGPSGPGRPLGTAERH